MSETAIRKRVKKLERGGIIRRHTIEVDMRKLGFKVNALIGIDTKPEAFIKTIERLRDSG